MKKIYIAASAVVLFYAIQVPVYAGLVEDCSSLVSSQQYAKAETVGHQAIRKVGNFDAYICLGRALSNQGKAKEALPIFQAANDLARGDRDIGVAANWLGNVFSNLGDYDKALEHHNRELAVAKRLGNASKEATALNNVALVYDHKGELDRALRYYEESLRMETDEGEKTTSLGNIALILNQKGDKKKAIAKLEEAVAINRRLGNHHSLGQHLLNLGSLRRQDTDLDGALLNLEEGLVFVRQVGDKAWEASGQEGLARLREARGELPQARAAWAQSAKLYRGVGNTEKARGAETQGDRLASGSGCEEFRIVSKHSIARSIAETSLKKSPKDAASWLCLAKSHHNEHNYAEAIKEFEQAIRFSTDKAQKADALNWVGWSYRSNNDPVNAKKSAMKAVDFAREAKVTSSEVSSIENLLVYARDDSDGDKRKFAEYCTALDIISGELAVDGWTWQTCGDLSAKIEDWPTVVRRFEKAVKAYSRAKRTTDEGKAMIYLGNYLAYQAPYDQAKLNATQGLKLLSDLNPPLAPEIIAGWQRYTYSYLGAIAGYENNPDLAKKHYRTALESARIENSPEQIALLTKKLADQEPPSAAKKEPVTEKTEAPIVKTTPVVTEAKQQEPQPENQPSTQPNLVDTLSKFLAACRA